MQIKMGQPWVDHRVLADKVSSSSTLMLVNKKIDINSVIFMYMPKPYRGKNIKNLKQVEVINVTNQKIQDNLLKEGKIWLYSFSIPDLSNALGLGESTLLKPLRFMSGNPLIEEKHLDDMIKQVQKYGEEIEKETL